jgi:four helix bundle protein
LQQTSLKGTGEKIRDRSFNIFEVAQGSLKELETHLILSGRVALMVEQDVLRLLGQADGIGKMLRSMIRSLQQKL